jgi:hypothetical protein
MKRNAPVFGLIIGLIMPLIGVVITYFLVGGGEPFSLFISRLANNGKQSSMILSLSCLLNIIPFLYYTNKRLDLTARGVLLATMLYFVLFLLLKFAWS